MVDFSFSLGLVALFCSLALSPPSAGAQSPKSGAWATEPAYVLEWLQSQRDPDGRSCCGLGEAVNVEVVGEEAGTIRLKVINPRGRPELSVGQLLTVGADRLARVNFDRGGLAVAWVNGAGHVYCLSEPPKV